MVRLRQCWSAFARTYVGLCFRRPIIVLAVFVGLAAFAGFQAMTRIKVVTDLAALLPEGTSSVAALRESRERIGSTDFFTIAIESASRNPQHIATAQDRLQKQIEMNWEDAKWVQVGRDASFFRDHALYFLPEKELEDLKWRLEKELISASAESMPGMVDLLAPSAEEPGEQDGIDGWYDSELPRRLGLPPAVSGVFHSFFQGEEEQKNKQKSRLPSDLAGRLIGPKCDVGVVLVQLSRPSTDLEYARWALGRGEGLIRDAKLEQIDPGLRAEVVGAYRSFMEVDAVADDGALATVVSLLLVLVLIIGFFRSPRTLVVVVGPLLIASGLTMGIVAVTYGRLTALTIFVLAMLVGMGIDYGIHLFGRTILEFRRGSDMETATRLSIEQTGPALLTAAATTIASMLTLLFAHFEGFAEFGVVSAVGLTVCVVVFILATPPLVALMEKCWPFVRVEKPRKSFELVSSNRFRKLAFGMGILITVVSIPFLGSIEFEHDFRNLRGPSTKNKIRYGRAIGKDKSTTPAVVLGKSNEQMKHVHQLLLDRLNEERDPLIKSFLTLHTFVPDETAQLRRQKIITEIKILADKKALRKLKGEKGRLLARLRELTSAGPFGPSDLPDWAKMIVAEKDGTFGKIGHLYARVQDWNSDSVRSFQERYGELFIEGESVKVASSSFILSDVVAMVKADGGRLLVTVATAILVILAIFTRSIAGTALLALAVFAAGVWTAGAMGLLGIRLGLYNLIAMPVILGVGVDGAIHLYHSYRSVGSDRFGEVLSTTGRAVTASSLTTAAGFAGLFFVSHKGLQTIGHLAVTGVLLSFAAVILFVPFLATLTTQPFGRVRSGRGEMTGRAEESRTELTRGEDTLSIRG